MPAAVQAMACRVAGSRQPTSILPNQTCITTRLNAIKASLPVQFQWPILQRNSNGTDKISVSVATNAQSATTARILHRGAQGAASAANTATRTAFRTASVIAV